MIGDLKGLVAGCFDHPAKENVFFSCFVPFEMILIGNRQKNSIHFWHQTWQV